jgi:hypothetical protein
MVGPAEYSGLAQTDTTLLSGLGVALSFFRMSLLVLYVLREYIGVFFRIEYVKTYPSLSIC